MSENKQGTVLKNKDAALSELREISADAKLLDGNGFNDDVNMSLVKVDETPFAEKVTNEQLVAKERDLTVSEDGVQKSYEGLRGWLRLGKVSRVIGMLSLYLYLDQYDLHRKQHLKIQEYRLENARKLTWFAVLGEKFYSVKLWFFHNFILLLQSFFVGNETNKERNQEKQALWLKDEIIKLGPTFIKLGQSMGTRADLLPLPFVKELGTLVD
ncbi:MAG: hypothetical protein ACR2J3_05800, partial [Aridibacter sp.]